MADINDEGSDLIVEPLIRLPAEIRNEGPAAVAAQKKFIKERIVGRDNQQLYEDEEAWDLMCQLGGDLMINAFACNFKINGKVNQDVVSLALQRCGKDSKWLMVMTVFSRAR